MRFTIQVGTPPRLRSVTKRQLMRLKLPEKLAMPHLEEFFAYYVGDRAVTALDLLRSAREADRRALMVGGGSCRDSWLLRWFACHYLPVSVGTPWPGVFARYRGSEWYLYLTGTPSGARDRELIERLERKVEVEVPWADEEHEGGQPQARA